MISIEEIRRHYPEKLKGGLFTWHMIKEYLQALVLYRISKSIYSQELAFIGGTSLRFCYGLDRFSEDLDFDYWGEDKEMLREMFNDVARNITKEGLNCTVEHNYRDSDNFCKLIFSGIHKIYKLDDPRKKIWVKIDIQKNRVKYNKVIHYINRFGLYFPIHSPEKNILLSMKAIVLTKRTKARDMYDFSFLCPDAKLDFKFIQKELYLRGIKTNTPEMLKELILKTEKETNISEKEHEISMFLMDKNNIARVSSFYDYVRSLDFTKLCV